MYIIQNFSCLRSVDKWNFFPNDVAGCKNSRLLSTNL